MGEIPDFPADPKKPMTVYNRYMKEIFDEVKQKHPGKKMTDLTSIISKQFSQLIKSQKQEFERQYLEEKKVYDLKLAEYRQKYKKEIAIVKKIKKAAQKRIRKRQLRKILNEEKCSSTKFGKKKIEQRSRSSSKKKSWIN